VDCDVSLVEIHCSVLFKAYVGGLSNVLFVFESSCRRRQRQPNPPTRTSTLCWDRWGQSLATDYVILRKWTVPCDLSKSETRVMWWN